MTKEFNMRLHEELNQKLDRIIKDYNEAYPANIKLKRSLLVDYIIRGVLRGIETPEDLRNWLKENLI